MQLSYLLGSVSYFKISNYTVYPSNFRLFMCLFTINCQVIDYIYNGVRYCLQNRSVPMKLPLLIFQFTGRMLAKYLTEVSLTWYATKFLLFSVTSTMCNECSVFLLAAQHSMLYRGTWFTIVQWNIDFRWIGILLSQRTPVTSSIASQH